MGCCSSSPKCTSSATPAGSSIQPVRQYTGTNQGPIEPKTAATAVATSTSPRNSTGTLQASPTRAKLPPNITTSADGRRTKNDSDITFSAWSTRSGDDPVHVMRGRATESLDNTYAADNYKRRTTTSSSVYSSYPRRAPPENLARDNKSSSVHSDRRFDSAMSSGGYAKEYIGIIGTHPSLQKK